MFKKLILYYFIFFGFLQSQTNKKEDSLVKDYQYSREQYIMNPDGKVYMKINFWGPTGESGTLQVQEGIDFASLISEVGAPSEFVNIKKIRLYREKPDDNGQLVYYIDLNPFLKTGDRSNFPQIKPNDTIVIRKTWFGVFVKEISTLQTIFTVLTFFIQFYSFFSI